MTNLRKKMEKRVLSIAILTGIFSVVVGGISIAATNIIEIPHRGIAPSTLQSQAESAEDSIRQLNAEEQQNALRNIVKMNQLQNLYRAENRSFSMSLDQLASGLNQKSTFSWDRLAPAFNKESQSYRYAIRSSNSNDFVQNIATAKTSGLKNYLGILVRHKNKQGQSIITSVMCIDYRVNQLVTPNIPSPRIRDGKLTCPSGYVESMGKFTKNRDGSLLEDRNGDHIRGD